MTKKGVFITFEGPEGSGKSTHIQLLAGWLRKQRRKILVTREPGGTAFAQTLRNVLLHSKSAITPVAELLLYEADRAQHMSELILPALKRGQIVLCDRFSDSTIAYQGYGRGLDLSLIHTLNRIASFGRKPDVTILLDVPVDQGLRKAKKKGYDRLESAGLAFHRRVRKGFLKLAQKERSRFKIVPQQKKREATQDLIREALELWIPRLRPSLPAGRRGG
jgi:dTMP kinase